MIGSYDHQTQSRPPRTIDPIGTKDYVVGAQSLEYLVDEILVQGLPSPLIGASLSTSYSTKTAFVESLLS